MKHLSEEELVDLYYGEPAARSAAEAHLGACRSCAAAFERLKLDMGGIEPEPVPQRDANYGWHVWQVIRPSLAIYEQRKHSWRTEAWWRPAVWIGACALLVLGSFLGGSLWERHTAKRARGSQEAGSDSARPVILVVLTDHFDRSERLLVALEHTSADDTTENAQLQAEARDLLASNQLYRTTANELGNPAFAATLDQLQPLLAEVANDPNGLSEDGLRRLREEMSNDGIVFEIRVLLSKPAVQAGNTHRGTGALI